MRLLILALCFYSTLSSANKELPDYKAEKIAPNTYVIHGPAGFPSAKNQGFMNNPVFTITNTGVVLIDPGSSLYTGRMVLRQIRKLTDKPVTHVLNTHIHGDHWLGNQALKDDNKQLNIMAHPAMIAQAKAGADQQWIKTIDNMTEGASKGTKAVIPDQAMEDQASFSSGGITFRILAPGKAHSGTDIMIHIVEQGVLVTGDNVTHQRIGRLDDATFRGNIAACDVALTSGATVFVPGHGPSGDKKIIEQYRHYLSTIYNSVAGMIDEGLAPFEMKPKIVAKLQAYKDWADFESQVGKHVSLAMLEAEQAAFE